MGRLAYRHFLREVRGFLYYLFLGLDDLRDSSGILHHILRPAGLREGGYLCLEVYIDDNMSILPYSLQDARFSTVILSLRTRIDVDLTILDRQSGVCGYD